MSWKYRSLLVAFDILTLIIVALLSIIYFTDFPPGFKTESVWQALGVSVTLSIVSMIILFSYTYLYYLANEGTRNASEVHQSWLKYMTYGGGYMPDLSVIFGPALSVFIISMIGCYFGLPKIVVIASISFFIYGYLRKRHAFKESLLTIQLYSKRPEITEDIVTTSFKPRLFGN